MILQTKKISDFFCAYMVDFRRPSHNFVSILSNQGATMSQALSSDVQK